MINAGKLNQRIEIRNPTSTTNEIGEPVTTYSSDGKVWASVYEKVNKEFVDLTRNVPGTNSLKTYEIIVRANQGLSTSSQIVYKEKLLGIQSIADYSDGTGHFIVAQELNNA